MSINLPFLFTIAEDLIVDQLENYWCNPSDFDGNYHFLLMLLKGPSTAGSEGWGDYIDGANYVGYETA